MRPQIEIYEELDPRLMSEEYKKWILKIWEEVKPKCGFPIKNIVCYGTGTEK